MLSVVKKFLLVYVIWSYIFTFGYFFIAIGDSRLHLYLTSPFDGMCFIISILIRLNWFFQVDERFACTFCSKLFTNKSNLRRHMTNHTGNYKYFCELCRRGFGRKDLYDEHMMVVHEGRRFYCDSCGKSFTQKGSVNYHKKKDHSLTYWTKFHLEWKV